MLVTVNACDCNVNHMRNKLTQAIHTVLYARTDCVQDCVANPCVANPNVAAVPAHIAAGSHHAAGDINIGNAQVCFW